MSKLVVSFYNEPIGRIETSGPVFNWASNSTDLSGFFEEGQPEILPPTLRFLQQEGWLAEVLEGENPLKAGVRFLSNISIIDENSPQMDFVGLDAIHADLDRYCNADGICLAEYKGPSGLSFRGEFERKMRALWSNNLMPKLSGAQVKMPVSLMADQNGGAVVLPAVQTSFSHILKLPRDGFMQSLPAVEWMGMQLTKLCGVPTAKSALLAMPQGMAPALLVQRFDIPDFEDDLTKLTRLSDFCTFMNLDPNKHKYDTDILDCFKALSEQSSRPEEDRISLFKRLVVSHYLCDSDMHLKNISVLKTIDRESGDISVRFSPAYDSLTTVIFDEVSDRESALTYSPEPDLSDEFGIAGALDYEITPVAKRIEKRDDLMSIAKQAGISEAEADRIINDLSQTIVDNAIKIAMNPPSIFSNFPECLLALKCAATEIVARSDAPRVPEWKDIDRYSTPEVSARPPAYQL